MNLLCSIIYMIANKIDNLFIIDDTDKIYQINETLLKLKKEADL